MAAVAVRCSLLAAASPRGSAPAHPSQPTRSFPHASSTSASLPPRPTPLFTRNTPPASSTPPPSTRDTRLRATAEVSEMAQAGAQSEAGTRRVVKVEAIPATPESFSPFGTLVLPADDGGEFGPLDARLDLSRGTPRVYLMRLKDRTLGFDNITHHASVTQCLASAGNGTWYLGVAPASVVETPDPDGAPPEGCRKSKAGHWYRPPTEHDIRVFKFQGPCIAEMHKGTWHAGPLFLDPYMDFFNLELSDTNVVDHTTHYFGTDDNLEFQFDG